MVKEKVVRISKEFKSGLDKIGHKNETYEDVLKRIIPQRFVKNWWKGDKK